MFVLICVFYSFIFIYIVVSLATTLIVTHSSMCVYRCGRVEVQDAIGAAGGLRVVVEALRQHPQVFNVQNWGTYALQLLVKNHAANQVRG